MPIVQTAPNNYSMTLGAQTELDKVQRTKFGVPDPSTFSETVTVGSATGSFTPVINLPRASWTSSPCNIKIQLVGPNALFSTSQIVTANAITGLQSIRAINSSLQVDHSPVGLNAPFNEWGGLDHTTTLLKASAAPGGKLTYSMTLTNCQAFLQPSLTKEWTVGQDLGNGVTVASVTDTDVTGTDGLVHAHRPIYVVGALVFMHSSKGGMVQDTDANVGLTTGQLGTLYARIATDSSPTPQTGYTAWSYSGSTLTETLPTFVNPVYPIVLSPAGDTFGYTTAGGTAYGISGNDLYAAYPFPSTSNAGTATSITVSGSCSSGSQNFQLAIYTDGASSNLVTGSNTANIAVTSSSQGWLTGTSGGSIAANTTYDLGIEQDYVGVPRVSIYYNSISNFYSEWKTSTSFGTWPTSVTWSSRPYQSTREYSIYCTYTAGGGTNTYNVATTEGVLTQDGSITKYKTLPTLGEGFKIMDSPSPVRTTSLSITEGMKSGDSDSYLHYLITALSDGTKIQDAITNRLKTLPSLSDGFLIQDTPTNKSKMTPSLSEGTKIQDALANLLKTYPSLSDGFKIQDTLTNKNKTSPSISEGIKVNDAYSLIKTILTAMSEGVKINDQLSPLRTTLLSISEGLSVQDLATLLIEVFGSDLTFTTSSAGNHYFVAMSEGAKVNDNSSPLRATLLSISEGLLIQDLASLLIEAFGSDLTFTTRAGNHYFVSINEISALADLENYNKIYAFSILEGLIVDEGGLQFPEQFPLNFVGFTETYHAVPQVSEGVKIQDTVQKFWSLLAKESLKINDFPSYLRYYVMSLLEGLKYNDSPQAKQYIITALSDAVKLQDSLGIQHSTLPILSEGVLENDALSNKAKFNPLLNEGTLVNDGLTGKHKTYPSISEGVRINDSLTDLFRFHLSLLESFKINDSLFNLLRTYPKITEGVKIADLPFYGHDFFPVLMTEGILVNDSLSNLLRTYPKVSEGVKIFDLPFYGRDFFFVALTEGLLLQDTIGTMLRTYPAVNEGTKIQDALSNLLNTYPAIAEGLLIGDTEATHNLTKPGVVEDVLINDITAIIRKQLVSLSEAVKVNDTDAIIKLLELVISEIVAINDYSNWSHALTLSVSEGLKLQDSGFINWHIFMKLLESLRVNDLAYPVNQRPPRGYIDFGGSTTFILPTTTAIPFPCTFPIIWSTKGIAFNGSKTYSLDSVSIPVPFPCTFPIVWGWRGIDLTGSKTYTLDSVSTSVPFPCTFPIVWGHGGIDFGGSIGG